MSNNTLKTPDFARRPGRRWAVVGGVALAAFVAGGATAATRYDAGKAPSWSDRQQEFTAEGYTPLASGKGDETVDLTTELNNSTAPVVLAYSGTDHEVSFRIGQAPDGEHTLNEFDGGGSSLEVPSGLTATDVTVFGAEPGTEWVVYQAPTDQIQ